MYTYYIARRHTVLINPPSLPLYHHHNIPLDEGWPLVARVGVAIPGPSWGILLTEYQSVGGTLAGFWLVLN